MSTADIPGVRHQALHLEQHRSDATSRSACVSDTTVPLAALCSWPALLESQLGFVRAEPAALCLPFQACLPSATTFAGGMRTRRRAASSPSPRASTGAPTAEIPTLASCRSPPPPAPGRRTPSSVWLKVTIIAAWAPTCRFSSSPTTGARTPALRRTRLGLGQSRRASLPIVPVAAELCAWLPGGRAGCPTCTRR